MITPELLSQIEELHKRAGYLWRYLDVDKKKQSIAAAEEKMADASFWDDNDAAQKLTGEVSRMKRLVEKMETLLTEVDDVKTMAELADEEEGDDAEMAAAECEELTNKLQSKIDLLELQSFLSGPHDSKNAILSVHAGAGGTESCDWADMLFRMYSRWAERSGFEVEIQDLQSGEEAGISKVTMRIAGDNAYGFSKAERGVHRLVRISPFDSNKRRHTSFCSVDVIAEIDDDIDLDIRDEDLRVDTYRASGKGGQHVNKTDSAVRLTHLPTGIVVACQNERSQLKNKGTAMKILKSRIYEQMQDEKRSEMEKFYGEKGEIAWGNQIRNYVFQPYQMVKDLRTGQETSNVQGVMDGELDPFIHAWLRAGGPIGRSAAAATEAD
ncbi:peptide chain release factor 2 [Puniceicoccus vermicola]|uniref:peptide chain release factor 2 n=1 Tax=Puniceicoccus vermicola TaxID=388746 RepID=UPI001C8B4D2E|nr:peptide chain release factor 2 [Puniceicoccus vermicola]